MRWIGERNAPHTLSPSSESSFRYLDPLRENVVRVESIDVLEQGCANLRYLAGQQTAGSRGCLREHAGKRRGRYVEDKDGGRVNEESDALVTMRELLALGLLVGERVEHALVAGPSELVAH